MIQSDHPAGKRMRRRRGGANRLIKCRRDPPAKVLAARISMSHLVPLLEFNLYLEDRSLSDRFTYITTVYGVTRVDLIENIVRHCLPPAGRVYPPKRRRRHTD